MKDRECFECLGDCFVPALTEREILHPDATDWDGSPLANCPACTPETDQ